MKNIKILFLVLLIANTSYSQFDRVDLTTGTLKTSVPLYEFKFNDFTLPISLTYTSEAIKVKDEATWVGLGWSLNARGRIDRIVRGKAADEVNSIDDTEPDLFSYYVNGISGEFYLDSEFKAHQIPFNNLKIDITITDASIESIEIIDVNGNKYFFDSKESMRYSVVQESICRTVVEQIVVGGYFQDNVWVPTYMNVPKIVCNPGFSSITSTDVGWLLSSVETINGNNLSFEYAADYVVIKPKEGHKIVTGTTLKGKRLTRITSSNGDVVDFIPSEENREDLNSASKYLSEIVISNNNDAFQKKCLFTFSYNGSEVADYNGKRLMLNSIDFLNTDNIKITPSLNFTYYEDIDLPEKTSYAVDLWGYYNGVTTNTSYMPALFMYPDLEGHILRVLQKPNYTGTVYTKSGANRMPDTSFSRALLLKTLTTQYGGVYRYNYEPHSYVYENEIYYGGGARIESIELDGLKTKYNYNNLNDQTSGKILSIPQFARTNFGSDRKDYTLEEMYTIATTVSSDDLNLDHRNKIVYGNVLVAKQGEGSTAYEFSIPFSFNEDNNLHSTFVSEECQECEAAHKDATDCWGFVTGTMRAMAIRPAGLPLISGYNIYPFPPNKNYMWKTGKLLSKTYYNEQNIPVKIEDYTYTEVSLNGTSRNILIGSTGFTSSYPELLLDVNRVYYPVHNECNIKWCHTECTDGGDFYPCGKLNSTYDIITDVAYLVESKTEIIYDQYDSGNSFSNTETYTYNNYGQVALKSVSSSDGRTISTKYKYPIDVYIASPYPYNPEKRAISIMALGKNMVNVPVETNSLVNNKVVGASVNRYIEEPIGSENIVLASTYGLESNVLLSDYQEAYQTNDPYAGLFFDPRLKPNVYFDEYDANNNLLQAHTPNNNYSSTLYGYNNTLPIATATNAKQNEIYFTSFEDENSEQTNRDNTLVHNGEYSYVLNLSDGWINFCELEIPVSELADDYKLSTWYRSNNLTNGTQVANFGYYVYDENDNEITALSYFLNETDGEWKYYDFYLDMAQIKAENPGVSTFKIEPIAYNRDDHSVYFDDFRLHPKKALLTTYTHKPLVGVTSETDANNKTISYEYDELGRLLLTKDHEGNIIEQYEYNYRRLTE